MHALYFFLLSSVRRLMLTAGQLQSSEAYGWYRKRNDFLSITHDQCCDWHYKLCIPDKAHFKVKVIKITQVWEAFTRLRVEHPDFSFSLVPVRPSHSGFVSLKRRSKVRSTSCETSHWTPQSSHLTFCWNTRIAIKSKSFLSRRQFRHEQAAFGQLSGTVSHTHAEITKNVKPF